MDITVAMNGRSPQDVLLLASLAARLENQDAIDTAVVGTLPSPADARQGVEEIHFQPFDPVCKRTQMTYRDCASGETRRSSKGAPQKILDLFLGRVVNIAAT